MADEVTSKQYSINWRDFVRGLVIATLTPVLVIIQNSLDEGQLVFHWKQLGMSALAGLIAYLIKNFFSSTPCQLTK